MILLADHFLDRLLARSTVFMAVVTFALGAACVAGHALGVPTLASLLPVGSVMAPNTGVMFMVLGLGLLLVPPASAKPASATPARTTPARTTPGAPPPGDVMPVRRRASRVAGALALAFGVVGLVEHLTGVGHRFDQLLLFGDSAGWYAGGPPGRPVPQAAVGFTLLGAALMLLDSASETARRVVGVFAQIGGVLAVAMLLGYVARLSTLYQLPWSRATPLPTALAFLAVSIGLITSRPDRPPISILVSTAPSGRAMRQLLLTGGLVLPCVAAVLVISPRLARSATDAITIVTIAGLLGLVIAGFTGNVTSLAAADQQQRQLVRELRDQRDFGDSVLHSLFDGLIVLDADGVVTRVNPRWCEVMGFPADQIVGCSPPYPWWEPENQERQTAELRRVLAGRTPFEFETVSRRADGGEVALRVSVSQVPDDQGGSRMAILTVRDLTEEHRIEAERTRAAQDLDRFFNLSIDLMAVATTDGYLKRINPAWERVLGFPTEELLSRPYLDLVHPDDVARVVAEIERLTGQHHTVAFENRLRCRDGGYRWLSWYSTPIPEEGLLYAVGRDITDQRNAAEAQARLAAIVENSSDAIIGTDLDGAVTSWNAGAERMYGYRADEMIGRSIRVLCPPEGCDQVDRYLARVRAGEQPHSFDAARIRKDGTRLTVALAVSPIRGADDEVMGTATIARDVTERREFERAMAAARDDAVAAAQAKSQFTAMVSHEIRTPMNGLLGLTRLLLDTPLQAQQRRYVEAARTSARALLTITNDILDFAKIDAGRIDIVAFDFDLAALVEETIQVAAEAARGRDIEVIGYYPPGLARTVRGDQGRIRQVLLNLLGNAVKFTRHGEILLKVEPAPGAGPDVTFTVQDTGIGIDPADLPRLFEPFTQAVATATRVEGTGLGLTISRRLVELMGGQLHVWSTPGRGSRFSFTIALPAGPAPDPAGHRDALTGQRVLIVDDNRTGREFLAEHTRAWGMVTDTAPDGDTALDLLRRATAHDRPYGILVLDRDMPDTDGTDLARRISADPTVATPRTVLLTSGPHGGTPTDDVPADIAVLPKPIGPSALYNCLLQLVHPHTPATDPDTTADPSAPAAPASGAEPAGPAGTTGPAGPAGTTGTAGTAGPAGAEPAAPAGRGRSGAAKEVVLLAEDNEINQIVAVDTLARLGYQTDVANDGAEAVRLAAGQPYRAILMDVQMPVMDGFEATRELRRREPPDRHTPIIAMTAGALAEDRQRCLDAGMDDHLSKPLDTDALSRALERWAARTGAHAHGPAGD